MILPEERVEPSEGPPLELHEYLTECFQDRCRKYRKALKRCRKTFSHDSVHQLRVETRRLLAYFSLLDLLLSERCLTEVERLLKKLFKSSARLRDTQVQLLSLAGELEDFPELTGLHQALARREQRLTRRLKKKIKDHARPELGKSMTALRKILRRMLTDAPSEDLHWAVALEGVSLAFEQVVVLRRAVRADAPLTIHRLRLAFKKFRYMVESLQPLLTRVSRRRLEEMHGIQTRMGEIQDAEVLLRTLNKFEKKGGLSQERFRAALQQHQARLINSFLKVADRLFDFWPPSPSAPAGEDRKDQPSGQNPP